jgi:hypothetical protein
MGLRDIVRSGIAVANTLTSDLQATVTREPYTGGQDVRGEPNRGPAVSVKAIVEYKTRLVKTTTGEFVMSAATLTFLDPAIVIHPKDRLTMPNGQTGPILETAGLADRVTGSPVLTQVFLGMFAR